MSQYLTFKGMQAVFWKQKNMSGEKFDNIHIWRFYKKKNLLKIEQKLRVIFLFKKKSEKEKKRKEGRKVRRKERERNLIMSFRCLKPSLVPVLFGPSSKSSMLPKWPWRIWLLHTPPASIHHPTPCLWYSGHTGIFGSLNLLWGSLQVFYSFPLPPPTLSPRLHLPHWYSSLRFQPGGCFHR